MGVVPKSIIYDGKEYSVGRRGSGADVTCNNFFQNEVDPQAVDLMVVYAQDYFKVAHPIKQTFGYVGPRIKNNSEPLRRYVREKSAPVRNRIKNNALCKYTRDEILRLMPDFLFKLIYSGSRHDYRMDGDMVGESIDLKIDVIDHDHKTQGPAVYLDAKQLRVLLTRYISEIQKYHTAQYSEKKVRNYFAQNIFSSDRYAPENLKVKLIQKSIASWRRELSLSTEASELLVQRVAQNMMYYRVKEQPFVPFFFLRYFKTGSVRTIGERYKRNHIPLADLEDFFPIVDSFLDMTQFGPRESGLENPSEIAILLPRSIARTPIFGKRVKVHQLRHAFYYAAFFELLSPESMIYDEFGSERESKTYDTLEDLLVKDKIYEESMPNFITEEFFKDKNLKFFREHKTLDDIEERSILATALYLKENAKGHMYREALTHSALGHMSALALPWIFVGAIATPLLALGLSPLFVPYIPAVINGASVSLGHGNLVAYGAARNKIKKCNSPYEELYTLATLGN